MKKVLGLYSVAFQKQPKFTANGREDEKPNRRARRRMGEWARRRMDDAATLHKSHQFALPQETLKLAWPATRIRTSPVRRFAHSPTRLLALRLGFSFA
jgi:hypothetical protein